MPGPVNVGRQAYGKSLQMLVKQAEPAGMVFLPFLKPPFSIYVIVELILVLMPS